MEHFQRWAARRPSAGMQASVLVLAGALFLVVVPWLLLSLAPALDRRLGLTGFALGPVGLVTVLVAMVAGGILAVWSVAVQVTLGRGTPVPVVPTQALVATGPYRWSRNPMVLGTLAFYLGLALLAGSPAAVAMVALFGALLLLYVRLVEERELEARFGPPYVAYKARVPFLLPRPWRRPKDGDGASQGHFHA